MGEDIDVSTEAVEAWIADYRSAAGGSDLADFIEALAADRDAARAALTDAIAERDAALAEVERLRAVVGWWRLRSDALADDLRNASDNGYDGASTARLLAVNHKEAPMPDDDIAARLRDIAEQMTDVVTIGHEDDPFFSGGEIADVEEAADLIDSLRADNARLTRQLAFIPLHARLTAAAVAIEDSGKLPEGSAVLPMRPGDAILVIALADATEVIVSPGEMGVWRGAVNGGVGTFTSADPVEAAVAAIAATTEGA